MRMDSAMITADKPCEYVRYDKSLWQTGLDNRSSQKRDKTRQAASEMNNSLGIYPQTHTLSPDDARGMSKWMTLRRVNYL